MSTAENKQKWYPVWARQYTPFAALSYFLLFNKDTPMWTKCPNKLYLPEGSLHNCYYLKEDLDRICDKFEKYILSHDLNEFCKKYENEFKDTLAWGKKFVKKDFSKLSDNDFAALPEILFKNLRNSGEYQFLAFVALEGFVKKAENFVKSDPALSPLAHFLSVPHKETKLVKARLKLLDIVVKSKNLGEDIKKYCKKYAWINMYEFVDPVLKEEDVLVHLPDKETAKKELENYNLNRRHSLQEFKKLIYKVKDEKIKKLLLAANRFSYLKEMRDDYRRPFYFAMIPFWNEVARRTKLSFVETNHLLPDELKLAIKNPGKKWQILAQERIKNFAFELSNGKFYIHTDPEAIDKLLAQVRQGENKEEISGQAAYHGKTKGLVRIIYKKQDFHKFHEGDVLVTPMTHTEFLPLMKKASAIITDEGGVTCHAAIVAREMKKPCIIGTKIATKILKDGDLVEVDADKGIVKILK